MNLEQLQLGQDLAKEIKEVTNQLNAWKNAVNIQRTISLVIKGSNYFFEADKRYIDFNVMRSLAICKLEEKLKALQEQFNNL
jgi:hypothetical protein